MSAYARAVWRYCPRCAAEFVPSRGADEIERAVCPRCRFVLYEQPKVGAGALITDGGRLLLLQRAHDPWAGQWNLPAGYVERDEAPESAALRETREETGLDAACDSLFGVFHFTDDPRGAGILIVYRAHLTRVDGVIGPEVKQLRWFRRTDIPKQIAGGGHDAAVSAWAERPGSD